MHQRIKNFNFSSTNERTPHLTHQSPQSEPKRKWRITLAFGKKGRKWWCTHLHNADGCHGDPTTNAHNTLVACRAQFHFSNMTVFCCCCCFVRKRKKKRLLLISNESDMWRCNMSTRMSMWFRCAHWVLAYHHLAMPPTIEINRRRLCANNRIVECIWNYQHDDRAAAACTLRSRTCARSTSASSSSAATHTSHITHTRVAISFFSIFICIFIFLQRIKRPLWRNRKWTTNAEISTGLGLISQ